MSFHDYDTVVSRVSVLLIFSDHLSDTILSGREERFDFHTPWQRFQGGRFSEL